VSLGFTSPGAQPKSSTASPKSPPHHHTETTLSKSTAPPTKRLSRFQHFTKSHSHSSSLCPQNGKSSHSIIVSNTNILRHLHSTKSRSPPKLICRIIDVDSGSSRHVDHRFSGPRVLRISRQSHAFATLASVLRLDFELMYIMVIVTL